MFEVTSLAFLAYIYSVAVVTLVAVLVAYLVPDRYVYMPTALVLNIRRTTLRTFVYCDQLIHTPGKERRTLRRAQPSFGSSSTRNGRLKPSTKTQLFLSPLVRAGKGQESALGRSVGFVRGHGPGVMIVVIAI